MRDPRGGEPRDDARGAGGGRSLQKVHTFLPGGMCYSPGHITSSQQNLFGRTIIHKTNLFVLAKQTNHLLNKKKTLRKTVSPAKRKDRGAGSAV